MIPLGRFASLAGLRRRALGLSLVELMVALVLGVIIVAALSQLFVNVSRANQEMAKTNSQIENARFAMQFMQDDLAHAGFWDTHVPDFDDLSLIDAPDPANLPTAIPDPCRPYAEWDEDGADPDYDSYRAELLGIPIQVESAAPGTCGAIVVDQVAGTDVLVIRHADICEAGATNCPDTGTIGRMYFQPSYVDEAYLLKPLEVALADLDPTVASTDPAYSMKNRLDEPTPLRRYIQSIYYVRDWANVAGDGIPTLVRSQFDVVGGALAQQDAVPLVEGIEQFRVELGIDNVSETGDPVDPTLEIDWVDEDNWDTPTNRGDGIPDGDFVHCPTDACTVDAPDYQLLNAVVAKLYILARANEPTQGYTDTKTYEMGSSGTIGPFNDGFKRHVFSTTVRLENVSARRETP